MVSTAEELLKLGEAALSLAWSGSSEANMLCREAEVSSIVEFCQSRLLENSSGSIYVCGCPGTGKTMAAKKAATIVAESFKKEKAADLRVLALNCMSLSDPRLLFEAIEDIAGAPAEDASSRPSKKQKRCSAPLEDTCKLVIVDEVDHLVKNSKDQQLLHQLFQLPLQVKGSCVLIGISNTLHLVDKFLPRLKSLQCAPETLTFSAYNQNQVLTVLRHRLQANDAEPLTELFHDKALELCAKKVAATSGDMRRALDACRQALTSAYTELSEEAGSPSPLDTRKDSPDLRVGIQHMAAALAATLKIPLFETVRSLPLHQQMILSALILHTKSKKMEIPQQELFSRYCKLHKEQSLVPLSFSEFTMLCHTLADLGLIRISSMAKKSRKCNVVMEADQDDVLGALKGVRLFKTILGC